MKLSSFLIGFGLGAATVLMFRRLNETLGDEDPESLMSRLSDRLDELELRTQRDVTEASAPRA